MKDYYYLLGLKQSATLDEIKDSYRRLAKKFHPDLNDGDSFFAERFKDINEAYEVLSDYSRRKSYDASLGQSNSTASSQKEKTTTANTKTYNLELKQESINFLASVHNQNSFELMFKNNLGENIAAEYIFSNPSGKKRICISEQLSNDKTIIKLCGITALKYLAGTSISLKIKNMYELAYKSYTGKYDLDWKLDFDIVENHLEGFLLKDLCYYSINNNNIFIPKSDSFAHISLFSKALTTGIKNIFNQTIRREDVPKWIHYMILESRSYRSSEIYKSENTVFFGRCNRIQIKSDLN